MVQMHRDIYGCLSATSYGIEAMKMIGGVELNIHISCQTLIYLSIFRLCQNKLQN